MEVQVHSDSCNNKSFFIRRKSNGSTEKCSSSASSNFRINPANFIKREALNCSLRNQTKLLQLAEKIQVRNNNRRAVSRSETTSCNLSNSVPSLTTFKANVSSSCPTVNTDASLNSSSISDIDSFLECQQENVIPAANSTAHPFVEASSEKDHKATSTHLSLDRTLTVQETSPPSHPSTIFASPFQKVGSSFRRSRLYASFSPTQRSLHKLVKNDPTRTNIEHLVDYRLKSISQSSDQVFQNSITQSNDQVFQNLSVPYVRSGAGTSLLPSNKKISSLPPIPNRMWSKKKQVDIHETKKMLSVSNLPQESQNLQQYQMISSHQNLPQQIKLNNPLSVLVMNNHNENADKPVTNGEILPSHIHASVENRLKRIDQDDQQNTETLKPLINQISNQKLHSYQKVDTLEKINIPSSQFDLKFVQKGENDGNGLKNEKMVSVPNRTRKSNLLKTGNTFSHHEETWNPPCMQHLDSVSQEWPLLCVEEDTSTLWEPDSKVTSNEQYDLYQNEMKISDNTKAENGQKKILSLAESQNVEQQLLNYWNNYKDSFGNADVEEMGGTGNRRKTTGDIMDHINVTSSTKNLQHLKVTEHESVQPPTQVQINSSGTLLSSTKKKKIGVRPMSFDYSQRKAWIRIYQNMEVEEALSSLDQTQASEKQSVLPPLSKQSKSDKERKRKSNQGSKLKNKCITHLHLVNNETCDDQNMQHTSRPQMQADFLYCDDNENLNYHKTSTNSAQSANSLFSRFTKTFSLRFGNSAIGQLSKAASTGAAIVASKASNSKPEATPPVFYAQSLPCTRYNETDTAPAEAPPESSSSPPPELIHRRPKEKISINPSSGKASKRHGDRSDKCQSGDSGIQLSEDETATTSIKYEPHRCSQELEQRQALVKRNSQRSVSSDSSTCNSTSSVSPISMKKLSLVEIPNQASHFDDEDDGGFVSANEEVVSEEEVNQFSHLKGNNQFSLHHRQFSEDSTSAFTNSSPYYHSLPLISHSRKTRENADCTPMASEGQKATPSVRASVIRELLTTEENYIKTLNDIIQGFLNPCRERKDLFTEKMIIDIFANIEELLDLHISINESLQEAIDKQDLEESLLGQVFLQWADEFDLYSQYCYQNPMSNVTIKQLTSSLVPNASEYSRFFEVCRRIQMMDKLPLHGFLLRPIQRICQYHLQLSELLKHTPETHADHANVKIALAKMKEVATKVNDTQRRFDAIQEIVRIQHNIENLTGEDLVPKNCKVLHRGDLQRKYEGQKLKDCHLIILNKEILVCKKESSKKAALTCHFRLDTHSTPWLDICPNNEDPFFGYAQNAFRIWNYKENVWILLVASSLIEKKRWLDAFIKSNDNYAVDRKMAEIAKLTAKKTMLLEFESAFSQSSHVSGKDYGGASGGHTLPRLKKQFRKSGTLAKFESDLMLAELEKLRQFNEEKQRKYNHNNNSISSKSYSKFYV